MFEKEANTAESGRKRKLSKTFSQKLINGGGWNKDVLGGKFSKNQLAGGRLLGTRE